MNTLDSQLIATTAGQGEKAQSSPLRVAIDQYIPLPLPHVSLNVGTLPSSKAHTLPEPYVHSDHYCVSELRIIAHTKAHVLSAHTQSDTF